MTKGSAKKRNAVLSVCMILALVISGAFAYLTDHDNKVNTFTIGKVDITLHEDDWYRHGTGFLTDDSDDNRINDFAENVVPGQIVSKSPYVENSGRNDAYIFADVAVPGIYSLADTVFFSFNSETDTKADALEIIDNVTAEDDSAQWNVKGLKRIGEPVNDIREIGDFSVKTSFGNADVLFSQTAGVLKAVYSNGNVSNLDVTYSYKNASGTEVASDGEWSVMTVSLSNGTDEMPVLYSYKEDANGISAGTYLYMDMGYTANPFGSQAQKDTTKITAEFGSMDYTEIYHKDASENLVPGTNEGWDLLYIYTDTTYDLNYNNVTHLIFKYKNPGTDDVLAVGASTGKIFDAFRLPSAFDEEFAKDITDNYEAPQKSIVVSAYAIQSSGLETDISGDDAIWNVVLNTFNKEYNSFSDGRVGFRVDTGNGTVVKWKMITENNSSVTTPSCAENSVWTATDNEGNTITVNGNSELNYTDALNNVVFEVSNG